VNDQPLFQIIEPNMPDRWTFAYLDPSTGRLRYFPSNIAALDAKSRRAVAVHAAYATLTPVVAINNGIVDRVYAPQDRATVDNWCQKHGAKYIHIPSTPDI
jgi:hypothetical protein